MTIHHETGKVRSSRKEGVLIDSFLRFQFPGENKEQIARRLNPTPEDPRKHLRDQIYGNKGIPLSAETAHQIADALGLSIATGNPKDLLEWVNERARTSLFSENGSQSMSQTASFRTWLQTMIQKDDICVKLGRTVEGKYLQVGVYPSLSQTIIASAPTTDGFERVLMRTHQSRLACAPTFDRHTFEKRWQSAVHDQDFDLFAEASENLAKDRPGTKIRLIRIEPELPDETHLTLECEALNYYEGRGFHRLFENGLRGVKRAERYRHDALNLVRFGTQLPNILFTTVVVIIGDYLEPLFVTGLRLPRKENGYCPETWASFAEQFKPAPSKIKGDDIQPDYNPLDSGIRCLLEELGLKLSEHQECRITLQALFMEDSKPNYGFLALADLRPMQFEELVKRWETASHKAEHLGIAVFPATHKNIVKCLSESRLPDDIWQWMQKSNLVAGFVPSDLPPQFKHPWSPSIPLELAAALWYVDEVLPRRARVTSSATARIRKLR